MKQKYVERKKKMENQFTVEFECVLFRDDTAKNYLPVICPKGVQRQRVFFYFFL